MNASDLVCGGDVIVGEEYHGWTGTNYRFYPEGGADKITAGVGADHFAFFDNVSGKTTVRDFTLGDDLIALQLGDAGSAEDVFALFMAGAQQGEKCGV